ncbi:DASH complex subunit dam1 [Vanrija albida]|uniref:DASH complex subunit DAM1 n=1 Tax=Vanrija albida TaxID=181172 RepID=A0ABR3Q0Q2_9TREE
MPPQPHPLRRISTGSLSGLARSQNDATESPSGLDFLAPALADVADEAATLATNIQRMNMLHDALGTFNEGFSAYLYALKINAFCIEWPEAPVPASWERLPELTAPPPKQPEPEPEPEPQQSARVPPTPDSKSYRDPDMTYATQFDSPPPRPTGRARPGAVVGRKPAAPTAAAKKVSLAAKKKRDLEIAQIIDTQLPLEYRGSDPNARYAMEKVIDKLMGDTQGLAITQLEAPPELPRVRVNKCLISLIAKKLVSKTNEGGRNIHRWVGQ